MAVPPRPTPWATGRGTSIEATLAFTLSSGFDPSNASSAVATAVNQHVFEGLVDLDPITREPYNALAKSDPTPGRRPDLHRDAAGRGQVLRRHSGHRRGRGLVLHPRAQARGPGRRRR
ncbi:hypothetical protein V2I01_42325 [Micromonospora sp. BRA006-A]|nr:hypothetical protein [Micromonospora sp. BRA006-A]